MNHNTRGSWFAGLIALFVFVGAASVVSAQDKPFLSEDAAAKSKPHPTLAARCTGPITAATDVGFEGVRTTAFNWSSPLGGGESGRFDPVPLLSTSVTLNAGTCLNAHLSAMLGSRQTYGPGISAITMLQVTLTPVNGAPQHMFGHFETPYGIYGPAVAHEAERDVDMYSSNFFQRVGTADGEVPPGVYRVDVWWSGGPATPGGAIGADFILKLYFMK